MLRAEFPSAAQCDPAIRHAECAEMVDEMADELDVERTRGQHDIVERLWGHQNDEGRDGLTASIHLAKEVLGHGGAVDLRSKRFAQQLKAMSPGEVAQFITQLTSMLAPDKEALTLGGGS